MKPILSTGFTWGKPKSYRCDIDGYPIEDEKDPNILDKEKKPDVDEKNEDKKL